MRTYRHTGVGRGIRHGNYGVVVVRMCDQYRWTLTSGMNVATGLLVVDAGAETGVAVGRPSAPCTSLSELTTRPCKWSPKRPISANSPGEFPTELGAETRSLRSRSIVENADVIQASLRPAPHALLRSMLATFEIMAGATLAHVWAGGRLPDAAWLGGAGLLVFGASFLVIRDLAPLRWLVPALAAAQFGLHILLTVATQSATHSASHVGMHGQAHSAAAMAGVPWEMSEKMMLAHVASAVATALIWKLRRKLAEALVWWPETPALAIDGSLFQPTHGFWAPLVSRWSHCAPSRGPPSESRCA